MQVAQQPHRVCMALDDSVPAAHARDWALTNLVRPDKDELFLISVFVMPELEPVRCCSSTAVLLREHSRTG